jgi:hypothetical protein
MSYKSGRDTRAGVISACLNLRKLALSDPVDVLHLMAVMNLNMQLRNSFLQNFSDSTGYINICGSAGTISPR